MKCTLVRATIMIVAVALYGCASTRPESESERQALDKETRAAISRLQDGNPGMKGWFSEAWGYAVFPSVGKGAVGVGGAYGQGQVYQQGEHIGYATLKQATIGFQMGGQAYIEVIFFKNKAALDEFTKGNYEFDAQASAVAVTAGASVDAPYERGIAVFTMVKGGLMYEASIGGQKFDYEPR